MVIVVREKHSVFLKAKARACGTSAADYVDRLIQLDYAQTEHLLSRVNVPLTPDLAVLLAALLESLAQPDSQRTRPPEAIFAELRSRYGIAR